MLLLLLLLLLLLRVVFTFGDFCRPLESSEARVCQRLCVLLWLLEVVERLRETVVHSFHLHLHVVDLCKVLGQITKARLILCKSAFVVVEHVRENVNQKLTPLDAFPEAIRNVLHKWHRIVQLKPKLSHVVLNC